MNHSSKVRYWLEDHPEKIGNFGDYLSRILLDKVLAYPVIEADVYHFVGSVIREDILRHSLLSVGIGDGSGRVALWGCGMRQSADVSPWLLDHCIFRGVRGPLSRDALRLPSDTVLGDPGLLLPLFAPREGFEIHGRSLCLLHHSDPIEAATARKRTGADLVRRATIPATPEGFQDLLACIAGARFVLAGALHGAIAAFAYGVPFAYLNIGYVDCPFKWRDFAASIGIPSVFAATMARAEQIYAELIEPHMVALPLDPILRAAPFSLRSDFCDAQLIHRSKASETSMEKVEAVNTFIISGIEHLDKKAIIDLLRSSNLDDLRNHEYLEKVLLPKFGLDPFIDNFYPTDLRQFCGKGFMSCQMPNQLAKYLAFLSELNIDSYLEIGVAMGGTFIITLEYLRRFNPEVFGLAVDMNPPSENMIWYGEHSENCSYLVANTTDLIAHNTIASRKWGLALIDGDHSEEGCWRDYTMVKEYARYVAFHDITNDVCPGVGAVWNRLTDSFPTSRYRQFTQQYSSFIKTTNYTNIMGLGVLELT